MKGIKCYTYNRFNLTPGSHTYSSYIIIFINIVSGAYDPEYKVVCPFPPFKSMGGGVIYVFPLRFFDKKKIEIADIWALKQKMCSKSRCKSIHVAFNPTLKFAPHHSSASVYYNEFVVVYCQWTIFQLYIMHRYSNIKFCSFSEWYQPIQNISLFLKCCSSKKFAHLRI